jgi:hypothetical protein
MVFMEPGIHFSFPGIIWQYSGLGGWHFVSLPEKLSEKIRKNLKGEEEGWGRMKVFAKTGNSEWNTAVWFDTKANTYLLPLKAAIRKKENLKAGKTIKVDIWI